MNEALATRIRSRVRDVPGFPEPGVLFKDITPVLADAALLADVIRAFSIVGSDARVDVVLAIESRGFIFGAPLALSLGCPLAPARKQGQLPHTTVRVDYSLEYGSATLEAHTDAITAGDRVLIVDDVLASGGTAAAAVDLVQQLGGIPVGALFLLELAFLRGRRHLDGLPITALVRYES